MKKSKVILAIALAVVLIITCMNVPTFSWFTRPRSKKGNDMVLVNKNKYSAYNGKSVGFSTTQSDDGVNYNKSTTNYSGTNINPHSRNYFCTTITNNSGVDQNVSLYASKLSIPTASSNGTLALGVNGPTRNYRDYTALAKQSVKTNRDYMRIYFEKDNSVSGWDGSEFYICWNEDPDTGRESLDSTGSNGTYTEMYWVGTGTGDHYNQYFADIPKTATHAFFAVKDWGTNNNGQPNWGMRSQTLWDLSKDGQSQTKSVLFKLTNKYSGSNPTVEANTGITGAGINSYYSNITVAKTAGTFNAALSSGEYLGNIEYYSGDESVFTVNKTSGVITPKAEGEAILYTKAIGKSYGDFIQVETFVRVTSNATNYEYNDVPIVRNILIPGAAGDDTENPKNVVKIYWYVINNSDTKKLNYTIDTIYLGL